MWCQLMDEQVAAAQGSDCRLFCSKACLECTSIFLLVQSYTRRKESYRYERNITVHSMNRLELSSRLWSMDITGSTTPKVSNVYLIPVANGFFHKTGQGQHHVPKQGEFGENLLSSGPTMNMRILATNAALLKTNWSKDVIDCHYRVL